MAASSARGSHIFARSVQYESQIYSDRSTPENRLALYARSGITGMNTRTQNAVHGTWNEEQFLKPYKIAQNVSLF